MGFTTEDINSIIEEQLDTWPLARENFFGLMHARRKPLPSGDMACAIQLNPARIVSTGAKTDAASIKRRPCFLCSTNRPQEQHVTAWHNRMLEDWELLVNPYPILPVHFTIAHKDHRPQAAIPLDMAAMAEEAPDLVFFYNGAHAGASAPDHCHAQAVLSAELPLMRLIEAKHPHDGGRVMFSDDTSLDVPYHFISLVITPDKEGMRLLGKVPEMFGIDAETGEPDRGLVNAFFWLDRNGMLRIALVSRRRHRPSCYGYTADSLMISPGAIDMAGLLIAPRQPDFDRIDTRTARKIYGEVAFADRIPASVKGIFA